MTSGQINVLIILLAVGGVEVLFSPTLNAAVHGNITGKHGAIDPSKPLASQLQGFQGLLLAFASSVVLLLVIAYVAPSVATWFSLLLLALAVLQHAGDIAGLFNAATTGLNNLSGGK